jgi:hypothetical protein
LIRSTGSLDWLKMIKHLTKDDIPYCLSVMLSQKKFSGTTPPSAESQEKHLNIFFSDTEKYTMLGYFKNDQLVSWVTIGFYEGPKYGKFWVVLHLFSTLKHNYFSFRNPEISELISNAFNVAESKGVYRYFYCVSEKISKAYEIQWAKKNPLNYHGVYELEDIAVIPANTIPESKMFWRLMGEETRPHVMYIKSRIRK